MTKHYLAWLACIVLLGGALLAARVDAPRWTAGDSSVRAHLTALVSCLLPASAADPSAMPAVAEPTTPECDASAHDRLDDVWMTPC